MTRVLLIRHGENDYTRTGKLAGWTKGVHLNKIGQAQVKLLADHLGGFDIQHIYSSPLVRALETARPIASVKKLNVIKCNEIGEVRYGRWQGKSLKILRKQKLWEQVQRNPSICSFPDGESIRSVQYRAVEAVEKLVHRHSNECIVLVSHADVIKMILAHYLGLALDLYQRLIIQTASISEVVIASDYVSIVNINVTINTSIKDNN